jgi:hypothetical protein
MKSILAFILLFQVQLFAQTLTPGPSPSHWNAIVTDVTPGPQGDPGDFGYTMMPSGRWTTQQFQTYSENTKIGVVGFHPSGTDNGNTGIASVTFIANNGTPLEVTEPTINTTSQYWEWWCYLAPIATINGPVEVRAIIKPMSGQPFVLQGNYKTTTSLPTNEQSLVYWSDGALGSFSYAKTPKWIDSVNGSDVGGNGTEGAPYATIRAGMIQGYNNSLDGGKLILKAGYYHLPGDGGTGSAKSRWFTIEAAPGVDRENVSLGNLDGESSTKARLIRLRNLHIDRTKDVNGVTVVPGTPSVPGIDINGNPIPVGGTTGYFTKGNSSGDKVYLWFEGCDIQGAGRTFVRDYTTNPKGDVYKTKTLLGNAAVSIHSISKSSDYRSNIRNMTEVTKWAGICFYGNNIYDVSGDLASKIVFCRDNIWSHQEGIPGDHGDWVQSPYNNSIFLDNTVYNNRTQLIFQRGADTADNMRISMVNNILFINPAGGKNSHISRQRGNVYWHNTFGNQNIDTSMGTTKTVDGVLNETGVEDSIATSWRGNIMRNSLQGDATIDGVPVDINTTNFTAMLPEYRHEYNHFRVTIGWMPGTNVTFGGVNYRNFNGTDGSTGADFYPVAPAAVKGTVPRTVPWDRNQATRPELTYHGALDADGVVELFVIPPYYSIPPGTYEEEQSLTLTSSVGSTIHYTLDGSEPTEASAVYSTPLNISTTTTVKAMAVKEGLINSGTSSIELVIDLTGRPSPPIDASVTPVD